MNKDIAKAFCNECQSAFENWATCRIVFQDRPSQTELSAAEVLKTPIGQCIERVYRMCHEAWIIQVVRLSDPGGQRRNKNLSIDLLCEADDWGDESERIGELQERLRKMSKLLKAARNKIIAHNDLPTQLKNTRLGCFPEGMDEHYFSTLAELATMVWRKWCPRDAPPWDRNRFFEFSLTALEDDELSPIYQARKLRACLIEGIQNSD